MGYHSRVSEGGVFAVRQLCNRDGVPLRSVPSQRPTMAAAASHLIKSVHVRSSNERLLVRAWEDERERGRRMGGGW